MGTPSEALTRVYAWFSALAEGDTDLMDDLLAHGLPVDVPHPLHHTTALMEATRLGRASSVHWLLLRDAAATFLNGRPPTTALHCAIKMRHWNIANILLNRMTSAAVVDAYGRTPLHLLCLEVPQDNHLTEALTLALALTKKACQIDALDHEGITALHYCVINDHAPLARLLLDSGANPNMRIPDTQVSPLVIAALERNKALAGMLLGYGANPNLPTRDGSTAADIMPNIHKLKGSDDQAAN